MPVHTAQNDAQQALNYALKELFSLEEIPQYLGEKL